VQYARPEIVSLVFCGHRFGTRYVASLAHAKTCQGTETTYEADDTGWGCLLTAKLPCGKALAKMLIPFKADHSEAPQERGASDMRYLKFTN